MPHHTAKGVGLDGGHRMKNILDDCTANPQPAFFHLDLAGDLRLRFDFLQCGKAFAFEIAPAGLGKQWFRHKTILNTQRITHCRLEIFFNL